MAIVSVLESPVSKTFKFGVLEIEGWAFSVDTPIKKVVAICNGKKYDVPYGLERADVGKCHQGFYEISSKSGFALKIQLSEKEKRCKQHLEIFLVSAKNRTKICDADYYPTGSVQPEVPSFSERLHHIAFKTHRFLKSGKRISSFGDALHYAKKMRQMLFPAVLRVGNCQAIAEENPYLIWQIKHGLNKYKQNLMEDDLKNLPQKPLISIIMPAYESDPKLLGEAIQSVKAQYYTNWELIINDDCSPSGSLKKIVEKYAGGDKRIIFNRMHENSNISIATNAAVELASGEYLFLMDHDDLIPEDALYWVVKYINLHPGVDILYSDDDKITMDGERYAPQFKPDYSPELLLSFMYFCHAFILKRSLFENVGGCRKGFEGSQDYDLALRAVEKASLIIHIPYVLYHWRATPLSTATSADTKPESIERGRLAVEEAVKRRGINAKVIVPQWAESAKLGIFSLVYNSTKYPKVSIVIPTKNHLEILKVCVESILHKMSYPNYELVIVDNDSTDPEVLDYYKTLECKLVHCHNDERGFNFSRMVNVGTAAATGDYIVLLNNDTEVIAEDWLEQMLVYMQQRECGIVGAKLLYSDGTVQHAGVVLKMGNGVAGHAFKLIPDQHGGYMSFANVSRNYSAVTAACFMTRKSIYNEVGGFDEDNFSVSYNDVDFCLKVRKAGYRIVYNPAAKLYHHEGKSRGVEQTGHFSDPREEYNLRTKWGLGKSFNDPYYNENLSLDNELFQVNPQAMVAQRNNKRLKVLLVTHNLDLGGAPLVQFRIAAGLKDRYDFAVLSYRDGAVADFYRSQGIPVTIVDFHDAQKSVNLEEFELRAKPLLGAIQSVAPDIVYCNTIETLGAVCATLKQKLPLVWGIHESVNYKEFLNSFDSTIAVAFVNAFRRAAQVVFVADATRRMFGDLDCSNFVTIRNGLDLKQIDNFIGKHRKDEVRKSLGIKHDSKVITVVGTTCFRKGQMIFVQAAKRLVDSYGTSLRFLIVGGTQSSYLDEIKEYLKRNKLEQYIQIVYETKDVYQYYLASDFFVCSSYEESAPLVLLEAMAFRLPIVSTNVFGIPEMVRDGREALLIEPGNSEMLALKLKELLENNNLRSKLVYNASYRLKSFFDAECMFSEYDTVFQNAYFGGENLVYKTLNAEPNKRR